MKRLDSVQTHGEEMESTRQAAALLPRASTATSAALPNLREMLNLLKQLVQIQTKERR